MILQHALIAFSVAAILAPFSYYMGLAAKTLRLPQITGYLISGIVCGPYLLGILSGESLSDLSIIEGACLSVIGLAAGAELHLPELSKSKKQVLGITLGICILTWSFCYLAFEYLAQWFQFVPNSDPKYLLATATLGATLMMTRSPASAIAVLKEVDGKGPFCSLVMAVVVVKDVVVIVAFALNIELVRILSLPANAANAGESISIGLSMLHAMLPILSVMVSITLGCCGGLVLAMVLRPNSLLVPSWPGATSNSVYRSRMFVVLVVSTVLFKVAHHLEAEALLACVTMGLVVANRRSERADKEREELHAMLGQIMSLTNVAFFGLAGAALKLSALKDMFWAAIVIFLIRLVAIYFGSWLGCYATSTVTEFRRLFWMSMITQAGVAMGLARLAGTRFPEFGGHFQTLMMSIILLNLAVGPPIFRHALMRIGEAKGSLMLPTKASGTPEPEGEIEVQDEKTGHSK